MADELFQLSNGRYITSEEISKKMYYIKNAHPELPYQEDSTGYSWDEAGMADLFSECYQNDTRYCAEAKSWYTYDSGRWQKDVGSLLVAAKIKEFVRLMALYCGEIADEEKRKQYMSFVAKMGDRRFRDRLMKDAADSMRIEAEQFDTHPYLINCKNGTYDLETMTFREHSWKDFLTMQTNFEYSLQEVRCERWEKFIKEVTQNDYEKADYLQRALGYSILGTGKEECMFILHGKTTRNGKSTLLSAIHHLLGDYASVAPVAIICKSDRSRDGEAPSPVLASLKGRRFVTMAESNQYGKLDEEAIKQFTGGEEITARHLHEKPITFRPQFTLWLSCNDLPSVSDKSLFASERIRVIEFNRHFTQEEQDKNLKNEFQEMEAMQGIFSWLLAGYYDYLADGLSMSAEMQKVINAYKKDNDIVLQFLEEKCETQDGAFTLQKSLYDSFKMWCKSNGYYVATARRFNSEMETHPEWHSGRVTRNGYPGYKNIVLKGT